MLTSNRVPEYPVRRFTFGLHCGCEGVDVMRRSRAAHRQGGRFLRTSQMVVCGAHLRLCGGRMLSRRWLCKRQTPAPQPQHISDPALSELCHRFPAILSRRTSRAEDLFHVHSAALVSPRSSKWPRTGGV
ncbi:hypothetical protein V5799_024693 [Amblyomma americanum]|uniref:Uncharacterized protein n=1 Tax=Amblyomma americanum TaxID=6943 RepID=A0AAQ4EBT9_AMBAM